MISNTFILYILILESMSDLLPISLDSLFVSMVNLRIGHDTKGIGGTMDRSVRNHKLSMESVKKSWNIKEEITCGISICNHEKTVSFFTCHGYNSEEGKGEVHVCMFCVQCTCIEDHQWIA